jgi:hypothetical protein
MGSQPPQKRQRQSCNTLGSLHHVVMVGIAQLVERLVVVQEVAGSSPVTHPNA